MNNTIEVNGGIKYARAMPREWEGLLAFTEAALAENEDPSQPTAENAITVWRGLETLSDEQLDENRYYALGLAVCGVARALREPGIREETVTWAARNIVDTLFTNGDADQFTLENVSSYSMHYPFGPLARGAVKNLTPAQHLLADSLSQVASKRAYDAQYGKKSSTSLDDERWRVEQILKGDRTAESISMNATAGTLATFSRVVKLVRHNREAEGKDNTGVTDMDIIQGQDFSSVLANFGTLRIDEFRDSDVDDLNRFLKELPTGEVVFQKDQKAKDLPPPALPRTNALGDRVILHAQRLKCPALHVAGMFKLMQGIVPEILVRADEMRQEKLARQAQDRALRESLRANPYVPYEMRHRGYGKSSFMRQFEFLEHIQEEASS